ncbi:MAG: hypothetical protein KC636_22260 [Myxococcales bacterium]|nr:hypothetical protein [Myxococcales bacterium]
MSPAPRLRRLTPALLALALACGDDTDDSASSDTAADCPSGDPPVITVVNDTPWTLAALEYAPCGASEQETFPFPGSGLMTGASLDVTLPAPGCYRLSVIEPSGCFLSPAPTTGELHACDTFTLALDENMFGCPGG